MEELPEYQICPKCGKRSTPYMENCWNCGQSFFVETTTIINTDKAKETEEIVPGAEADFEPEKISPCRLDEMNFTDRMFAYSLLFSGEMVIEFCNCDICKEAFKESLAFFKESDPEAEEIKKEAEDTEIEGMILDLSGLGL